MSSTSPVTAPLREARAHLRQALAAITDRVGEIAALPLEERTAAMEQVAAELNARLQPRLEREERTIHPVVDKVACEGPAAFSASMHRSWNPAAGPEVASQQRPQPPASVHPDGSVDRKLWAPSEGPCRNEVGGAGGEPEGWSVPIRKVCWD